MVTKLKKSRAYSKPAKAFAVVLIFICVTVITFCGLGLLWISGGAVENFAGIFSMSYEDYTDTEAFRQKFDSLADEAVKINLVYKSEGNIREGKAVDEDELISKFKQYYGIVDGVITSNTKIDDDYTVEITGEIPSDLIVNYNEYENLVRTKLRDYKNIYIQNQLNDYIDEKKELDSFRNFLYCIETDTGAFVAGNAKRDEITSLNRHIVLNGEFLSDKMATYSAYKNEIISENDYKLYAGIPNVFVEGDEFYENSRDFILKKQLYPVMMSTILLLGILVIFMTIYLLRTCGQTEAGGKVEKRKIDGIYNDMYAVLVFAAAIISVTTGALIFIMLANKHSELWFLTWSVILLCLVWADTAIGLSYLCSVSRHIKDGTFLKHTLIAGIFRKIGATLSGRSFSGWLITLFAGYSLIIIMLSSIITQKIISSKSAFVFVIVLIIIAVTATVFVIKSVRDISAIMVSAKKGAQGQFDEAIVDTSKMTSVFTDFAQDINDMQKGLKNAVEEAVKGERMKTDLITNVSHDLKTPLTSIISYADLLDREELNNPNAEKYVDVLVEKSVRLKQLIEDLIEASKVSSGNISVEKTKINYKQLVLQACGEYEEKFEASQLEMRFNAADDVVIFADGNHMWRIIDNLLSNVIKYAMADTRVYIDVYKEDSKGVFVIKNTSKHEINYNVENLTERFFRGDSARSSEGSGLGLSIANSLVVAQKGDFEIEADGDLFKVIVEMPLWDETKAKKDD